jgi:hypothetical protein
MSRAGGSTSRAEISPISIGSGGETVGQPEPGRVSEGDLEHALDRLSLSLERIERLLGELREDRRPHCSEVHTAGSDEALARVESEDPRVVRGGGPSAFTRRPQPTKDV